MMIRKILLEQYSEFAKHQTMGWGEKEEREHSHNNLWDPHSHPQMAEFLPETSYTGWFFLLQHWRGITQKTSNAKKL